MGANAMLIQVLKDELFREEQKIERARAEIFRIELELRELGVELDDPYTGRPLLVLSKGELQQIMTGYAESVAPATKRGE